MLCCLRAITLIYVRKGTNEEELEEAQHESDTTFSVPVGNAKNSLSGYSKGRFPRTIILLSSWRSGSSFLGNLLSNAMPDKTFYR